MDYIKYAESLNERVIDIVKEKITAERALELAESASHEVVFENANSFLVTDMIKITLASEGRAKFVCKMAN